MNMTPAGRTFRRCGCRDQSTGRRLGAACPRWTDEAHGSWYLSLELGASLSGRRRRLRLGGYPDQDAAQLALSQLSIPIADGDGGRAGPPAAG